jgi:hypothetical protein
MMAKQVQITLDDIKDKQWTRESADFINQLITRKPELRLGHQGIEQIKEHPWFDDFNWSELYYKSMIAPFIPENTDNFDKKYSEAPDKPEEETLERYNEYMNEERYSQIFKNYTYYKDNPNGEELDQYGKDVNIWNSINANHVVHHNSNSIFSNKSNLTKTLNNNNNNSGTTNNNNSNHFKTKSINLQSNKPDYLNFDYFINNNNNKILHSNKSNLQSATLINNYTNCDSNSNINNNANSNINVNVNINTNKGVFLSSPTKQYIDNFKYKTIEPNTDVINSNGNNNNNNTIQSRNNNNNHRQLVINTKNYYRSFSNLDLNNMLINTVKSLSPAHLTNQNVKQKTIDILYSKNQNTSPNPPNTATLQLHHDYNINHIHNNSSQPPKTINTTINRRNYLDINTNNNNNTNNVIHFNYGTKTSLNNNNISNNTNTSIPINKSSRNKKYIDQTLTGYTTSNNNIHNANTNLLLNTNTNPNNNYYLYSTTHNNILSNTNNTIFPINNNTLTERAYYSTINNITTSPNTNSNSVRDNKTHIKSPQPIAVKPLKLSPNLIPTSTTHYYEHNSGRYNNENGHTNTKHKVDNELTQRAKATQFKKGQIIYSRQTRPTSMYIVKNNNDGFNCNNVNTCLSARNKNASPVKPLMKQKSSHNQTTMYYNTLLNPKGSSRNVMGNNGISGNHIKSNYNNTLLKYSSTQSNQKGSSVGSYLNKNKKNVNTMMNSERNIYYHHK